MTGAAYANGPVSGGAEAYVNGLGINHDSVPSQVPYHVLNQFNGGILGRGLDGDSAWDTALRYAGEFGAFRVSAGVGYTENPGEIPDIGSSTSGGFDEETFFYDAGIDFTNQFENGALKAVYGVGVNARYYEEGFEREADSHYLHDISGALGFVYDFNDSVQLDHYGRVNQGSHGSPYRGYARAGVLVYKVLDYLCDTKLHYRFDGQALGDEGLGFTTSMTWGGFHTEDDDTLDSYRVRFIQEVRYTFGHGCTVFLEGAYGMREWDEINEVDSDHVRVGGGIRGEAGGISGELKGGYHMRNYDNFPSMYKDDAEVPYVEGSLGGTIDELGVDWRAYGIYGLQDLYAGELSSLFIDPEGFRGGILLRSDITERTSITADASITTYETNEAIEDRSGGNEIDSERISLGLGIDWWLNDNTLIDLSGAWVSVDYDNLGDDDFLIGQIRTTFKF